MPTRVSSIQRSDLKMLALIFAGLNIAIFQLVDVRGVGTSDTDTRPAAAARVAGVLSILVSLCVDLLRPAGSGSRRALDFEVRRT